ncbi:MAG: hypothetical protein JXN61_10450 [Sedimentisphaerales bacterium]|nr:hypothetical protein [Sedimentisphaerales bacterium]
MNDNSENRQGENSTGRPHLLLDACAKAIEQVVPEIAYDWSYCNTGERMQTLDLYIHESNFPKSSFDPKRRTWSQAKFVPWLGVEEKNISQAFVLPEDGNLTYGYPEYEPFLRVHNAGELVEILRFLLSGKKESHIENCPFARVNTVKRKLSEFVSGLYLVVCIDKEPYILDLKRYLQKMPEDLRSSAEEHFVTLTPRRSLRFSTLWGPTCEGHSTFLKHLNLPKLPPFGLLWRWIFQPLKHTHYQFSDEYNYLGIYLAPNLPKASTTFLTDYFSNTEEGATVLSKLENASSLGDLVTRFSEIVIEIPRQTERQIRWAIELRATREHFSRTFLSLSQERATAEKTLDLTWRKLQGIEITRSAYLEEVDSLIQPLPYFIEKPYRDFLRADPDQKADTGVNFAGKLYQVMACLAIEEFEQNWPSSGEPKPANLADAIGRVESGKPVSDGTWATLFGLMCKQAANYIPVMISIGSGYYQKSDKISELLAARNQLAHSGDTDRLSRCRIINEVAAKMSEILPILVGVLRDGFRDKEILIPLHAEFKEGMGQVFRAKSVMGFESDFQTVERRVVEGMDNYIDRRLIMYSGNAFVALRKYFICDEIYDDFFQVGLKK